MLYHVGLYILLLTISVITTHALLTNAIMIMSTHCHFAKLSNPSVLYRILTLKGQPQDMTSLYLQEKNDQIKRLTDELSRVRDQSSISDYQTCMEENSKLKRQAAQLQLEFDLVCINPPAALFPIR